MDNISTYIWPLIFVASIALLYYKISQSQSKPNSESPTIQDAIAEEFTKFKTDLETNMQSFKTDVKSDVLSVATNAGSVGAKVDNIIKSFDQFKTDMKADQMNFENLFADKTSRGKLGERGLEAMLINLLGESSRNKIWFPQHTFKTLDEDSKTKTVDQFIKYGEGAAADESFSIDSKFPWNDYAKMVEAKDDESRKKSTQEFVKGVKQHIKTVATKYIIPGETGPYAIMYVASQGVYNKIRDIPGLYDEAIREKKVVMVGPDELYRTLADYGSLVRRQRINRVASEAVNQLLVVCQDVKTWSEKIQDVDKKFEKITAGFRSIAKASQKVDTEAQKLSNFEIRKSVDKKENLD